MDQLITIGVGLGGIVSNSNSELAGPDPTAEVTLRIPSRWFETAVSRVGKLGALQSEGLSGQDVTSQYVDLQGRIAALQTSRSTYLTILSKATSIGDILAVQQQIDGIQQQLEQLQGQQRVLSDQIQYATLDVTLSQRASAPPGPPSGVHKAASHAVHDFVVGFEDIVGALGALLLALLIAAVVIAGLRISWRYARRSLV
jgi:hypothetical protein